MLRSLVCKSHICVHETQHTPFFELHPLNIIQYIEGHTLIYEPVHVCFIP